MLSIFLFIALTVFLADFGDKTQLTIILLSQKTRKHLQLLMGVLVGFLLGNAIAIIAGAFLGHVLPTNVVKIVSGIVFIIFGLLTLRSGKEEKPDKDKIKERNPFYSGATLIFLSEIGDKSQIAIALFATKYNPLFVLFSSMVGLTLISILTIYLSHLILKKVKPEYVIKISGLVFILLGVIFLIV